MFNSDLICFSSYLQIVSYNKTLNSLSFFWLQGLLVDIHGFSAMVERMVDQAEADESGSRFFTALEIANVNEASLVFVEINTFKRLIHLRLKMTSGSDKEITNHLAGQLRHLRNSLVDVTNQNAQTKSDLIQRNSDVHTLHQQLEALRLYCTTNIETARGTNLF